MATTTATTAPYSFQRPESSEDTTCIKEYVGEKATTVREPGNEHNRFAVAVLEDERLCTV